MNHDPARWERIQTLFHDALAVAEPERRAFLEAECGGDAALVSDVLALLEADAGSASALDRDLADWASDVLDGSVPSLELVGPYRIRSVLGHGGMGVVYLAERPDLGSRAAVKVLRDAALSPARRERFASEQRTLARLNHPSIARLYDADTLADGTPYFVMEYVEGVPLTAYCETHARSIPDRLRLFRAVCEAVQFAHRHAIVHRDLKPSNILVTADGTVKLLDFGIAKQLDNLDTPAAQTTTGLRLMTPAYAAPEQVRGEPVGIHTDVYALGVILYELLAGRLPYDLSNRTPGQAEAVILEQQPDRPSVVVTRAGRTRTTDGPHALRRGAWTDLDVLCLTAIHKDPDRRYRTVDALMQDLDHYLRGEPLEARPDTLRYRAGKFVRRNWRPLTAAAAVASLVIALVVFYTVRLAAARDAALAEAARTERIQRFMLNLFEGGDEAAGPADTLRVVTLIDRGVQEARVLDGEAETQAELYETLGSLYQKLGDFDRADSLLRAALEQRRTVLDPDDPATTGNLVALGLLRSDQAQLEEAERLVREALDAGRRRLPPEHPAMMRAVAALGHVLQERGDYEHSAAVLEEAVRMQAVHNPGSAELSESLTELASTHFYAGNYGTADSLFRIALALDRRIRGERHPVVADGLINLGAVQVQQGNYQEGERYYREALEITESYYGGDHYETASNLTMLGRALMFQRRNAESIELLQRALAIQERVFGPDHPRVASIVNELGNVALLQDDLSAAEGHFRRILSIYRSVYGEKHYLVGIAVANLASVFLNGEQYERAEQGFREAVAIYTEAQGPDHLNTGIARIKLGRALTRQKRWAEAERESLGGYEILMKQSNPTVSWLRSALTDLVTIYEATNRPEQAARFRAELADPAAAAK